MRNSIWIAVAGLAAAMAIGARTPAQDASQNASQPLWAFPVPSANQPPRAEESGPIHVPGSTKAYTAKEIDNLANPPDWFPDEHPAAPPIVTHGNGKAPACGSCHLMSGLGHPESADLAGMPADYIAQQMADFKSGDRVDPIRMSAIAKDVTPEEAQQAADYFSSLKPMVWTKVQESDTVPKTYINRARQRIPIPGAGTEPIGDRIIEVPVDPALVEARDPKSGFIAYVPPGSLEKGKELVTTGANGTTLQCAICHGPGLTGLGNVPRIAGLSPEYIGRQLYHIKDGMNNSRSAQLMKGVVAHLTDQDILNISAYVASLPPAAGDSSTSSASNQK